MSLWWARRDQLDKDQRELIEELDLEGNYLVLGPPGSGKTNVLLRRAQFVRTQQMPNILVLTYTRSLTEFLKTGCRSPTGAVLLPPNLITTYDSWMRSFFNKEGVALPEAGKDYDSYKKDLATGALDICRGSSYPKYDVLFIDEAQDLIEEEIELLKNRGHRLFFVGDDRQRIYDSSNGIQIIRSITPNPVERNLHFHYRLAPEICGVADRILTNVSGDTLSSTAHYDGPSPGRVDVHPSGDRSEIFQRLTSNLRDQVRVYGDLLSQGDKIGVVVPRKADREEVLSEIDAIQILNGSAQIVRARTGSTSDRGYSPEIDPEKPILILTEQGCKGLEFRALHWLFVDCDKHYRSDERYYTVVTRAKTSLDIYHSSELPQTLARAHAEPKEDIWK